MSDLRDARLRRALESAPDAHMRPDAKTRAAIRAAAVGAVTPAAAPAPWWRSLWTATGRRGPWNAAFASVLLASLVTVLWYDREVPDARSDKSRAPVPSAPPPVAAEAPAAAPAPLPAPADSPAPPRRPPPTRPAAPKAAEPAVTQPAPGSADTAAASERAAQSRSDRERRELAKAAPPPPPVEAAPATGAAADANLPSPPPVVAAAPAAVPAAPPVARSMPAPAPAAAAPAPAPAPAMAAAAPAARAPEAGAGFQQRQRRRFAQRREREGVRGAHQVGDVRSDAQKSDADRHAEVRGQRFEVRAQRAVAHHQQVHVGQVRCGLREPAEERRLVLHRVVPGDVNEVAARRVEPGVFFREVAVGRRAVILNLDSILDDLDPSAREAVGFR